MRGRVRFAEFCDDLVITLSCPEKDIGYEFEQSGVESFEEDAEVIHTMIIYFIGKFCQNSFYLLLILRLSIVLFPCEEDVQTARNEVGIDHLLALKVILPVVVHNPCNQAGGTIVGMLPCKVGLEEGREKEVG